MDESSLRRPSSWLLAGSGLLLYLWAPTLLTAEDLAAGAPAPWWLPVVAPPLLYALLLLGFARASAARRLAGLLALWGGYLTLGLVTPAIHQAVGLDAPPGALDARLWAFPAVPLIQLLSVPLALFPLHDPIIRPGRAAAVDVAPTPPPARAGRGWDDLSLRSVGGERLHEEGVRAQVTPGSRPPRREPTRPIVLPPHPTPPPAAPPLPERPRFEVRPTPAPEEERAAASPAAPEVASAVPASLRLSEIAATPATEAVAPPGPAAGSASPAVAEPPAVDAAAPVALRVEEPPPAVVEPVAVAAATLEAPPVIGEVVAAAPAPPVVEPPPPADVAVDTAVDVAVDAAELASRLAPVGPLAIETRTLMGITLCTACPPRLEKDAVVQAAFRFLSFLTDGPGAPAVTQVTVRGGAGAMVLTPLGPLAAGGPVLAAAIPQRGALALLEILSLGIAGEYRAARAPVAGSPALAGRGGTRLSPPATKPVPPRVEALARSLTADAPLRPFCLEDPAGGLVLYLLLADGVEAGPVARLASDLYRVMQVADEPGGVGPFQSVVVRLGSQRVVVRPVAETCDRSAVLVTAGPHEDRPGLARLQLERVAARLAAPSA